VHPFPMQDIASMRIQELRTAAEHASLVAQAKAARPGRPRPGWVRREVGWWLVATGLRLAIDPADGRRRLAAGVAPLRAASIQAAWAECRPGSTQLLTTRTAQIQR
jgi:hypothetical protein